MLTIKKRYPKQKLFLYGGSAFIAGYAAVMLALVQTNTNLQRFANNPGPVQVAQEVKKEAATEETAQSSQNENPLKSDESLWTVPTAQAPSSETNTQPQTPAATQEPAPVTQEPTAPTEPTTPEPTPEPEPEDPGVIDDIIDIITP